MKNIINIIKTLNPFTNQKIDNKILYVIKILLSALLVYFISLVIGEVLIIGGSYLFGYNATDKPMPFDIMLLCSYYGYLITILFVIIYTKKINKIELDKIGLNKNVITFFKGMLIGIISLLLIVIPLILCRAIDFSGINNNINWLLLILYLFGYLIQSSMEELICRGYLFHRLKNKIPTLFAMIISILFFSIGHLSKLFDEGIILGIIGITNLLLISMIWTTTTLKDKNIYSAIGFHFIWNFILFNIIGLNLSGLEITNSVFKFNVENTFLTGGSYGIESSIITTIVLSVILLIIKRKVIQITIYIYRSIN